MPPCPELDRGVTKLGSFDSYTFSEIRVHTGELLSPGFGLLSGARLLAMPIGRVDLTGKVDWGDTELVGVVFPLFELLHSRKVCEEPTFENNESWRGS